MQNNDTVNLLRECDAGIKMGVSSIDGTLKYVKDRELKGILERFKRENEEFKIEIENLLNSKNEDGKEPNLMSKGMSWLETNVKLGADGSDDAVADLITDGCNMGVKSLSKYLNQYKAADGRSQRLTVKLAGIQEKLAVDIRKFL
jgi:hypothetical protein